MIDKDIVILVAEDDDGHYVLTKKCLKKAYIKNKIIRFNDGKELMNLLNGIVPEAKPKGLKRILILNVDLPIMDGIEVLSYMNQNNLLDQIPTIMFSCINDHQISDKCLGIGSRAFVEKPDWIDLVRSIKEISKDFAPEN